ncbi:serine/threonine protein kinase [Fusarium oxysporum f. sp. pisi HDV247]|uniref:Serine/threonine protein kinase n=1 Tax=Fusarium oxysporum f. sp. pisi HDV247 TaxID=1080344 RepID=W9NNB5_FUSOX|nr:serine/threonine protein kinase [Fusarium oxysporum f. sp. pisi HDV247]
MSMLKYKSQQSSGGNPIFVSTVHETPDELDWAGRGTSHVDFPADEVLPLSQGRFLGHGINGGVFETTVCGQTVAWKRRYCRRQIGAQDLREMDILKKIDGRHIIKLVGTYTHGPFLGLLLWPVAVCDLGTFLEDVDNLLKGPGDAGIDYQAMTQRLHSLGIDTTQNLDSAHYAALTRLKQSIGYTSSAIAYLHQRSIRHKDIKPSYILLSSAGLWVTDFGTSTDFSGISQSITQNGERGTPKYFAPEVAEYEPNGRSADIFSLGCVFLEMMGLCNGYSLKYLKSLRPKKDLSFQANLDHILHWFNFSGTEVKSVADQQLMALVREMLAPTAQERPTAARTVGAVVGRLLRACAEVIEANPAPSGICDYKNRKYASNAARTPHMAVLPPCTSCGGDHRGCPRFLSMYPILMAYAFSSFSIPASNTPIT